MPSNPNIADWWAVWLLAGTMAFTAVTAVVTLLAYRHGKMSAGHSRPIVVKRAIPNVQFYHPFDRSGWDYWDRDKSWMRVIDLYLFNRSSVEQQVNLQTFVSVRILWPIALPASTSVNFLSDGAIMFPPYSGGNIMARVFVNWAKWPGTKELHKREYWRFRQRFLLSLRGTTTSGLPVSFTGWVRTRPFNGSKTQPPS